MVCVVVVIDFFVLFRMFTLRLSKCYFIVYHSFFIPAENYLFLFTSLLIFAMNFLVWLRIIALWLFLFVCIHSFMYACNHLIYSILIKYIHFSWSGKWLTTTNLFSSPKTRSNLFFFRWSQNTKSNDNFAL